MWPWSKIAKLEADVARHKDNAQHWHDIANVREVLTLRAMHEIAGAHREIRRLKAKMKKYEWTKKPTKHGWYWWRQDTGYRASLKEVSWHPFYKELRGPMSETFEEIGGQWAGPIPEPEEEVVV